jgi:hypothetical protein
MNTIKVPEVPSEPHDKAGSTSLQQHTDGQATAEKISVQGDTASSAAGNRPLQEQLSLQQERIIETFRRLRSMHITDHLSKKKKQG